MSHSLCYFFHRICVVLALGCAPTLPLTNILTPYPVCIHNLNHVSVFPLTLRLSCSPLCWPVLAYSSSSPTPYPTRCVDLSTYVILSFCDFSSRTNHFFSFFFTKVFQSPPPPRVLSLTFHFSPYSSPFLTSFSSLLHLPVCIFLLV